jgi:hypothetical protein
MSQYGRRFALHEFEIAACEPDALWRRGQQPARLSDEPLGVLFGDRRRFLRQRFIDHHDECRKFAQPLERRVIHHEVEVLSRAGDGRHIAFVSRALQFEERFVRRSIPSRMVLRRVRKSDTRLSYRERR